MRSKEDAHDYRYFPEPDLPPLHIEVSCHRRIAADLPELPDAQRRRFIAQYALPDYDAALLTQSPRTGGLLRGDGGRVRQPQGGQQLDHGGADAQDERARHRHRSSAAHARRACGLDPARGLGHYQRAHGQGCVREDVSPRAGRAATIVAAEGLGQDRRRRSG